MTIEKRIITVSLVAGFFLIGLGMLIIPAGVDAAFTGNVIINSDGSVSPATAPINVKGKSYSLNDDIDGMLTIMRSGISVNGKGYTITGDGTNYGIYLNNVDGVTIKNFIVDGARVGIRADTSCENVIKDNTIKNSRNAGIALWYDSDGNTIKANYVSGNSAGGVVLIYDCSENIVKDNTAYQNGYGFDAFRSSNNMFKDNDAIDNSMWGITFRFSTQNTAKDNYVDGGAYYGISIYYGTGNHIVMNNVIKNIGFSGIYLDSETDILVKDNEIYDCFIGIGSWFTDDITIKDNLITGSTVPGIYIDTATGHLVDGNDIIDNGQGIYFWNRNEDLEMDNIVTYNLIKDNGYGIYTDDVDFGSDIAYDCGGNTLHHNNIIDNTVQIYEGYDNIWDDGKGEGNFWSDYTGTDNDADGVGDTNLPHSGVDHYPLMSQC